VSGANGGSTFSFVIPAAPDIAAPYTPRSGGKRGSVLMCDDNDEFLEVTGTMLEEHGFGVTLARSGEQAVQRALDERPDVILLDQQLPGMSGMETVAALREHAATADIPVVVLSILPGCEDDTTYVAVEDWIQKPAAPARLFVALDQAIRPRDDTFRVLFVERDRAVSEILSALFGRYGVASFGATSGREAVALCERIRPDLIVLDDDLPDVEGVGIQDWLGRQGRLSALSVVGYEAGAVRDAERERRSVGAVTQILSKGQLTSEEFQWRVMTLLARPRTQRDTQEALVAP
jgi:CheY-like chemotaxis protein